MSERQVTEALNHCIDRLAEGDSIDNCIQDYPEIASELKYLLETGQASSLNRANSSELLRMHNRLDAQIETLIAETDFRAQSPFRLPSGIMVLVASLFLVFFGVFLFLPQINAPTGVETIPTETITATDLPEITPEPTATVCPLPDGWSAHEMRAGDTLDLLAEKASITAEEILQANCLESASVITEGDTINVPSPVLEDEEQVYDDDAEDGDNAEDDEDNEDADNAEDDEDD